MVCISRICQARSDLICPSVLGPAKWKEHYENALGSMQSPINIVTCDAIMVKSEPLNWSNHDNIPENMIMHNDGYSGTVTLFDQLLK